MCFYKPNHPLCTCVQTFHELLQPCWRATFYPSPHPHENPNPFVQVCGVVDISPSTAPRHCPKCESAAALTKARAAAAATRPGPAKKRKEKKKSVRFVEDEDGNGTGFGWEEQVKKTGYMRESSVASLRSIPADKATDLSSGGGLFAEQPNLELLFSDYGDVQSLVDLGGDGTMNLDAPFIEPWAMGSFGLKAERPK